jgi:hypothetical protein
MKWISVEEDLPPNGMRCLLYGIKDALFAPQEFVISEGKFCYKRGWDVSSLVEVHYWTDYPNVPKEEKKITTLNKESDDEVD